MLSHAFCSSVYDVSFAIQSGATGIAVQSVCCHEFYPSVNAMM